MTSYQQLFPLMELPASVLDEVIREGEQMLNAQLAVATASDQRALQLLGFNVTGASSAVAGSVLLGIADKPQLPLLIVGLLLAALLAWSAIKVLDVVRPKPWSFPGNMPENWLPERWMSARPRNDGAYTLQRAKLEQAYCLNQAIRKNKADLDYNAEKLRNSMKLSVTAIIAAGTAVAAILIWLT